MIAYQFIEDLFKAVLTASKSIEGRFYISSNLNGSEINTDSLGQMVEDAIRMSQQKKYPLAMMLPPRSQGDYKHGQTEWERYFISLFFVNTSHYSEGVPTISSTGTSSHTIVQDWHDMKRCAVSFVRVLDRLSRGKLGASLFRLVPEPKVVTPVSKISADRASGVRLDFRIDLAMQCELEDYSDIDSITVPTCDTHQEHKL